MPFQPGNSANPNGRPVGSRNKRTKELFDKLEARGDKDPIDFLSEIVTTHPDPQLRIQAAGLLTPYKHSKQSPLPVPRYVEHPITLPDFVAVEDAEAFLGKIPQLVAAGELDFQSGLDLSTMTRAWLSAKYERDEMKLKMLAANADPNPTITIKGGLPVMPGLENMIMPNINNGQRVTDEALPWSNPPPELPQEPRPNTSLISEPSSDAPVIESIADDSEDPPPSNETE
jgi:Family of unknown function (DUF5681)